MLKTQEQKKIPVQRSCPDCGSKQFYFRVKTEDFVCQKCGCVWSK